MKARNDLWVWIDLEMTGLDLSECVIVEIATVITDKSLNIIAEGPDIVIKRSKTDMAKIEEWPKKMHEKSGLLSSIETSNIKSKEAQKITLDFIFEVSIELNNPDFSCIFFGHSSIFAISVFDRFITMSGPSAIIFNDLSVITVAISTMTHSDKSKPVISKSIHTHKSFLAFI
jgi:hypothetical protein